MLFLDVALQRRQWQLRVNMRVPMQGVTAVFGRSGAGKTSMMNLIAGLLVPDTGQIILGNRTLFDSYARCNLRPQDRNIGYIFQEHRLFPHRTVEGNLRYGLGARTDPIAYARVVELLRIGHLCGCYPSALSGGEKQRVAIGRALLRQPDLLLMDEPLSGIDAAHKGEMLAYLRELSAHTGLPVLYVSHHMDELCALADRVCVLEQGQVVAFDSVPAIWDHPVFRSSR